MMAASKKHIFLLQESPLTSVFESRSGMYVLAIYCINTVLLLIYQIVFYVSEEGHTSWERDCNFIKDSFQRFEVPLGFWLSQHLFMVVIMYPLSLHVIQSRNIAIVVSWSIMISFTVVGGILSICFDGMGCSSRFFLFCETIRLGMKTISFMVEVVDLKAKKRSKEISIEQRLNNNVNGDPEVPAEDSDEWKPIASISHFVYFLFCPTALYSPEYPKAKGINWSRLLLCSYAILVCFVAALKLVPFIFSPFSEVGIKSLPWTILRQQVFLFCSLVVFLYLFALVGFVWMHCWHNVWAEVLLFGDRRFYSDYYTEYNLSEFFLKWNLLIQNWLFQYVYCPLQNIVTKHTANVSVILFQGVFHDYAVFIVTGYAFPVFTVFIIVTSIRGWVSRPKVPVVREVHFTKEIKVVPKAHLYNFICSHACNAVQGLWLCFLILEYFSRKNCPMKLNAFADAFVPRVSSCIVLE
jgi:hypothetical protein